MEFLLPPILYNKEGEIRKVGFELEFAEIDLDAAAACVIEAFGGDIKRHTKFFQEVVTSLGTFSLTIDIRFLTEKPYYKLWDKMGINPEEVYFGDKSIEANFENMLDSIASTVVPYEIGTPPIPVTELKKLEALRIALFKKEAKGTSSSMFYAFATHINPELPVCDCPTLLNYIRAFLLLYPWIEEQSNVNLTRKLMPFIKPFPEEYFSLLFNSDYRPDLNEFINDYYLHNPDRNRPLDLYPVLAYMDKEKISGLHKIGKVNARPTLHYRFPNSMVDDPNWTLAQEWNVWVEIEKLASNPDDVNYLMAEYKELEGETILRFNKKWVKKVKEWMNG